MTPRTPNAAAPVNGKLANVIAERHSVSVSLVNAIAERVMPIEKGKRGYQWELAQVAYELQAEKVDKWAEVFGELVDLEARTLYEYAATWREFHKVDAAYRLHIRFSAWQVFTRYVNCEGAEETFNEWFVSGNPPRVDVLRATMAARFGHTPTPRAARAKVSRLYKSLAALQVDVYNTVPIAAKAELAVAFAAVGRAVKIMEKEHGKQI